MLLSIRVGAKNPFRKQSTSGLLGVYFRWPQLGSFRTIQGLICSTRCENGRSKSTLRRNVARSYRTTESQLSLKVTSFIMDAKSSMLLLSGIKYLRTVIRKTDTITCRVLDLVDEMMLLGTPEHRIKADDLCSELALKFRTSSREERDQLPATLMTILGEIDEEESYHSAESLRRSRYLAQGDSSSSKSVTHSVRNPAFVERPLKTTHRQSIWPDQSLRVRDGKYPEHQGLKIQTVPEQAHSTSNTYPTPQLPTTHHRFPSEVSAQRPSTRSRRSGTAKKHPPQNYFQACEAIKKLQHQRKFDKFHVFSEKADPRDGLLMSYFRGKRDIVSISGRQRC